MEHHAEIETERLILRPLALTHTAALHEIHADAEAMRYWHAPAHEHLDETRAMIEEFVAGPEQSWVLIPRDGEQAIGLIYYLGNHLDGSGPPGMGYILHPHQWRKGLMTEAVRGALAFGFERLTLDRVELWIDARNMASQRVAERAGFTRRGTFPQKYPHETQSHVNLVYGLCIEEWRPAMTVPRTPAIETYSALPVLMVGDVRATALYYRDQLGFAISFLYGEPPTYGGVSLSMWTTTGAHIHFTRGDAAPAGNLGLYLTVGPGIDGLFETYKTRGVEVVSAPQSMPWGMREFAIKDCNGTTLRFGTPG